jgi:hypothetical protein
MPNPWLALEFGADPAERIRALRQAHEAFLRAGSAAGAIRPVVADSWLRSTRAHVDPDATAPIDLSDAEVQAYRSAHPLARALPLLRDLLGTLAEDGGHIMAICDASGRLLWVEGQAALRQRAEQMNFVAGARWDESHAGTNAPGTALALDHSVQIFAAEHFSRLVQPWTCVAAPIHDPRSGRPLGAVDITGGDHVANPHSLALVQATARAAEALLATGVAPANPAVARLSALGHDEALLAYAGRQLRLSRRHSEIVALLACRPEGMTGEQLGLELYGDELNPITVRAELSRLRRTLGPQVLDSRPYRLRVPVEADFLAVGRLLEQGARHDALDRYSGPLLPRSDAPGVVRLRHLVHSQLRASLLAAGDPVLLERWAREPWGEDDLAVWQALVNALPAHSPHRPLAQERERQLAAEYGVTATSLQRHRP